MRKRDVEDWLIHIRTDMPRIQSVITGHGTVVFAHRYWEPRVDVIEESSRLLVKVEVAGVRAENVQILYNPETHTLAIRGVRHEEDADDSARVGYHQLEIDHGEFLRQVQLPEIPIVANGIRAQYRNGFLLVTLPKQGAPAPGSGEKA